MHETTYENYDIKPTTNRQIALMAAVVYANHGTYFDNMSAVLIHAKDFLRFLEGEE